MMPSIDSPVIATPRHLWNKAFSSLSDDLKAVLEVTKTHKRDVVVSGNYAVKIGTGLKLADRCDFTRHGRELS